jgi:hypothetical protein
MSFPLSCRIDARAERLLTVTVGLADAPPDELFPNVAFDATELRWR